MLVRPSHILRPRARSGRSQYRDSASLVNQEWLRERVAWEEGRGPGTAEGHSRDCPTGSPIAPANFWAHNSCPVALG